MRKNTYLCSLRMCYLRLTIFGLLVGWVSAQPLSGIYTINGTSNFGANSFATIQEAFDSLNQRGASGTVTIQLPPGTSWNPANEPNVITLAGYACTSCRVTVEIDTALILQKSPGTTAGNRFVFRFGGNTQSTLTTVNNPGQLQNFTLDGKGKLIVKNNPTAGATTTGLIGIVSTATAPLQLQGFTIKGLNLVGEHRDSTFAAIYLGPDASLTTGTLATGSSVSNIFIENCTIDSVSRPIHLRGARTLVQNITVRNNRIGTASAQSWAAANNIGGIHILGVRNIQVLSNTVTGAERNNNFQKAGIRLDSCENFTIARNWIYGIRYTGNGGWGEYGIAVLLPASFITTPQPIHEISNNMIADILGDAYPTTSGVYNVSGIYVNTSGTLSNAYLAIVHNSIHLFGNNTLSSVSGGGSAAITIGSGITGGVAIQGNILQNTLRASQATNKVAYGVAFYAGGTLSNVTVNYNAYYIQASGATNNMGRLGSTDYATFTAWQGSPINPEANGIALFTAAPFVSNTNLHLVATASTPLINASNTTFNGTQDFDGETRPIPNPGPGTYGDPGTAPDIGADELDGTPLVCPTALAAPNLITTTSPNAGSDYLWGTPITLDTTGTNSPTASGVLKVLYSLDGGATWTAGPNISAFPASFTLPLLTPPTYTGTIHIVVEATQIPGCPSLAPDTSNAPLILNLTDRPGNRAATAIPLTLTNNGNGTWSLAYADSTNGPGTSNEFNTANGNRYGSASNDLFFKIVLPACFDSLRVTTCTPSTNYDTRIHLIHPAFQDSLSNDDHGTGICTNTSYTYPDYLSTIIALDGNVSGKVAPTPAGTLYSLLRDSLPLRMGDTLYLVVEGYSSNGPFGIEITGYEHRPSAFVWIQADTSVCVTVDSLPLPDIADPNAVGYEWLVNGTQAATTSSFTLNFTTAGTYQVIGRVYFAHPIWPASICPVYVADTVVVTVYPEPQASIQVGATTYTSGQTHPISASTLPVSETFTAASAVSGNQYRWALYNPGNSGPTPDASGTGSSFTHNFGSTGIYTLVLASLNGDTTGGMTGVCWEYDTLYVNVSQTTALVSLEGTFTVRPNPSQGTFTVVAPAAGRYELRLMDIAGKVVYAGHMEGLSQELRVSVPAGTYQLLIRGADGRAQVLRVMITE